MAAARMSDENELDRYLQTASRERLLSREDEKTLVAARASGDEARRRLIRANMSLVVSTAQKAEWADVRRTRRLGSPRGGCSVRSPARLRSSIASRGQDRGSPCVPATLR